MGIAVLVALLTIHLFSVGTPVFADEIPCTDRCNFRQGYCTPDGECRCYAGYEGKNCERCHRAPGCLHGTCDQSWQCNCLEGWGGPKCGRDLRVCERTQPCRNHATCINDGLGDYLCVCHPGFSGRHCQYYNAGGMSDTKPTTPPPTTTTTVPPPPPKKCKNDGRCQRFGANGDCNRCICKPGYVGKYCEENVNECLMRPCSNGAKCFDLSNNFFCECLTGYTGRYCENDVNECELVADMCYNGGVCTNTFGSYDCECPEGFSGKRCERRDIKMSHRPLIPRIIHVTVPQKVKDVETTTTTATSPEIPTTTATAKRRPQIVKNPDPEVRITRITHKLEISPVNGEYSASNNELLIRSEVDGNSGTGGSSAKAMQAMTFVFMGLAIVILIVILVLIYLRCFRNQGDKSNKNQINSDGVKSVLSAVEKELRAGSRCEASVVVEESHSDSDSDEATMQIQPCLTQGRSSFGEHKDALPACPSPPPPYALSAVDSRRTTSSSVPLGGYFVALPPVSTDSFRNVSETTGRKSISTSYGVSSHEAGETTSLLDADSPTMSHKIVV